MIRLITIDVDGTLVSPLKKLSKENIRQIKKASKLGVHIALASGRPFHSMVPYLKKLGLLKNGHYTICQNGSYIVDNGTKKPLADGKQTPIKLKILDDLVKGYGVEVSAMDHDSFYTRHENPNVYTKIDAYINKLKLKKIPYDDFPEDKSFGRFLILGPRKKIKNLLKNMPRQVEENYYAVQTAPFLIEVMDKKANKGAAVKELGEILGIDPSEIMSIGNEKNDIPMLEAAGFPVAMKNAVSDLKKHAKYITKSNKKSGVGYAIKKLIENKLEPFA